MATELHTPLDDHLFHGTRGSYWIVFEGDPVGGVVATAGGPTERGERLLGTVAKARGPTREVAEQVLLEILRALDG
jgi:hypothetical protein